METTNNIFVPNILHESTSSATQLSLSSELFRSRKLFLIGDVNAESMGTLMQALMYLDLESNEPIELYINSAGGQVLSSIGAYRYMTEAMKSPIHTYCIGVASSMASLLYLAGTERHIYEGTTIGLHYPANYEQPEEAKDRFLELGDTKDMICRIIADRTGHTFDEISNIIKKDKIYDADEALEFGLATNVIKKKAVDYHNNPFTFRPDDFQRGLPPPIERYQAELIDNSGSNNVIIPNVPKSLLHVKRKDNTTVFRFGFSYRIPDDGKIIYANADIPPSQTRFVNYRYNIDLGMPDKQYDCELSDGSGIVILTASEIATLYKENRNKYLANKVRRSALAAH